MWVEALYWHRVCTTAVSHTLQAMELLQQFSKYRRCQYKVVTVAQLTQA